MHISIVVHDQICLDIASKAKTNFLCIGHYFLVLVFGISQ